MALASEFTGMGNSRNQSDLDASNRELERLRADANRLRAERERYRSENERLQREVEDLRSRTAPPPPRVPLEERIMQTSDPLPWVTHTFNTTPQNTDRDVEMDAPSRPIAQVASVRPSGEPSSSSSQNTEVRRTGKPSSSTIAGCPVRPTNNNNDPLTEEERGRLREMGYDNDTYGRLEAIFERDWDNDDEDEAELSFNKNRIMKRSKAQKASDRRKGKAARKAAWSEEGKSFDARRKADRKNRRRQQQAETQASIGRWPDNPAPFMPPQSSVAGPSRLPESNWAVIPPPPMPRRRNNDGWDSPSPPNRDMFFNPPEVPNIVSTLR